MFKISCVTPCPARITHPSMADLDFNPQFVRALERIEKTADHCLITGKAGTGKSTLLKYFRQTTGKQLAVLAPTGVAAVNIRGQTIHSFFQFKPDITPDKARMIAGRVQRSDPDVYRKLHTVVLDEISMVRADLFECIDIFLRIVRERPSQPFGGVQMVLIGDLYQLPPVVTTAERDLFATRYPGPYFFHAPMYDQMRVEQVELETIYRQSDEHFIRLLAAVRTNTLRGDDIHAFNTRYRAATGPADDHVITLTAMNEPAVRLNTEKLAALSGHAKRYSGQATGNFGKDAYPTELELLLKVGAQVMLVNNDADGRWVNGTIGVVTALPSHKEWIEVDLEDGTNVAVEPFTWEMLQYQLDASKKVLTTSPAGKFTQFPLKLAWAITIHKSQGKTFDRVVIDVGRGTFASGQMYVALSRCRTLEGIELRQKLTPRHVQVDPRVVNFLRGEPPPVLTPALANVEVLRRLRDAIDESAALQMTYRKSDYEESVRTIRPVYVGAIEFKGNTFQGLRAQCLPSGDERTFRVDKIVKVEVITE